MNNTSSEDFSRLTVDRLARFPMVCAKEDPILVRRTPVASGADILSQLKGLPVFAPRRQNVAVRPRETGAERDTYLEELVALAITAVRSAEDASEEAHVASDRARRGKFAYGAFGALGLAIGLAGVSVGLGSRDGGGVEVLEIRPLNWVQPSVEAKRAPVLFAARPSQEPLAEPSPTPPSRSLSTEMAMVSETTETDDPTPLTASYVRPLPLPPNAVPDLPQPARRPLVNGRSRALRPSAQTAPHRPLSQWVYAVQRNISNLFR